MLAATCWRCGASGAGPAGGSSGSGVGANPAALAAPSAGSCAPGPLAARAAEVIVAGFKYVTNPDAAEVGQVLSLGVGGVLITAFNVVDATQIKTFIARVRSRSSQPLLVATDEEMGRVSTFQVVLGPTPPARAWGARDDPVATRAAGRTVGRVLKDETVDLDLAPDADLTAGPADGVIGDRSFSADPVVASRQVLAFDDGLTDAGVLATVKHFPGHGRSRVDSDQRLASVGASLAQLQQTDLKPFAAAIKAGVPVVMLGNVAYQALGTDLPATVAPPAYFLLRQMGFAGVAITDSLDSGALAGVGGVGEVAVRALAAGADALLVSDGRTALTIRDALVAAVLKGRIPEARLNEAVARMVALKGGRPAALVCGPLPSLR